MKVMKGMKAILTLSFAGLVTFSGCQSCAESAVEAASGGEVKIDGSKLPEGFPYGTPEGLVISQGVVQEKAGKKTFAVKGTVTKPAAAVADFYEADLKKHGLTVSRTAVNMGGMNTIVVEGKSATGKFAVSAMEQGGQTLVQMGGDP